MQHVSPKRLVCSPLACARNTCRFFKWNNIWPLCGSIRPCSRSGKYVKVSCSISLGSSLLKVVNIGWTCFIYLAYDVAAKEAVWYSRWGWWAGQRQKYLTLCEIWNPACPFSCASIPTVTKHSDVWSNYWHSIGFRASSEESVST